MHILLTNDDGIYDPGLWSLFHRLNPRHRISIVAPDRERSAVGHAITLHQPLRWAAIDLGGGRKGLAVSGTPADCVKMGLLEILKPAPDMVISGINPGANVGVNINYSGTVAAAREAALAGLPAVSVSIQSRQPAHLDNAAKFVAGMVDAVCKAPMPPGTFYNVNLPDLPLSDTAGVRVCAVNTRFNGEYFEKRIDPRNRTYYWQGVDMQDQPANAPQSDPPYDTELLRRDYVTISPICCDATDYRALEALGNLEQLNDQG